MLIHWIWFSLRTGISDREKAALLSRFPDPEELYYSDGELLSAIPGLPAQGREALADKSLVQAEEILEECARKSIHILTWQDAAYPARLKNIADPPAVLYYKGSLPDFSSRPILAVVGTRRASAYGLGIARRMGYEIGKCGGMVVSGLAAGIDAMAMRGALSSGQCVIGVLGCGVDVVYPKSNRALYADLEEQGCILSEFPPGTPPSPWHFPKRNRIISGLAAGVLVVEAPEKSGALITARQALEQGRDVFAVPGNIDVDTCAGSNALLREGAIAVTSGWEALSEYQHLYPGKLRRSQEAPEQTEEVRREIKVAQHTALPRKTGQHDKKFVDKTPPPQYSDGNRPSLPPQEQALLEAIGEGEPLLDDVIAQMEQPANAVLASLTMLEIKGLVEALPGGRIRRKSAKGRK